MKALLFSLILACGLCGCGSAADAAALDELGRAGAAVLTASSTGELPAARWPAAIARLDPERVYVTSEGLHIVTSSAFVEEQGFFVPRDPTFAPQAGGDPTYVPVRSGVFSYRLKG